MHELGVVFAAIDTLADLARENDLTHISRVTIRLGEVSGILQDYFADCWRWAVERQDLMRGCALEIETIPAVTICNACGRTYETVRHGRICPFCQSPDTVLVTGNEVEIKEIEAF